MPIPISFPHSVQLEECWTTCTGSGGNLGDSSLLANTAVVPTIFAVDETRDNTSVYTSPSTPVPATRNKLTTPSLGSAHSGGSNFVRHLPIKFLISWVHCMNQCKKCKKCNSRDYRSPPTRADLVSVSIYERNLSPQTSTTKIQQDMGCQQGNVLS